MDVGDWLERWGLAEYRAAFLENGVDAAVLPHLTAEDLKDLGVHAVGHRRKLLRAIAELQSGADVAVSAEPARQPAPASTRAPAEGTQGGERRFVAVLFADLVGYTRLTNTLGAEAAHALLDAFFSRVDAVVRSFGGRVDKHIGDCVMGVFGAPHGHDDDGERALRAAVTIREQTRELAAERQQDIDVHIGVTIGTVVASYLGSGATAEYAVTGESVNLAARLSDAAAPGEILLSEGLHTALRSRLTCAPAGALQVKGFTEPVETWRLIDLQQPDRDRTLFVGRRSELRQFEAMLGACREEGVGAALFLRGEAGIGKTRLSEEFERVATEAGFACHRGLVLDFGVETGRDAARAIVRELLGLDSQAQIEARRAAVRDALARSAIAAEQEVHLNDLLDLPQREGLRALYDAMDNERRQEGRGTALAAVIHWAAGRSPRLLTVEDVHWARAPLLRALARMTRAVGECPAILVMTSRLDGDPLDRAWRATLGGASLTTVDLSRLREEDARVICREVALRDPALVEGCIERSAGNPLFLEQLLRHAESQRLDTVPGSIQSLVQARVDRLAPGDKQAIQAAAVVGQRLEAGLLRFLADDPSYRPERLVETSLLRPQGSEYLFSHALVRDAVYASLLSGPRRRLHARAADWFEPRDKRLCAEHLAQAGSERAARLFLEAAREALGRYHFETALGILERGLAVAVNRPDQVALLLLRGEALHDFGDMVGAREAYDEALAVAVDDRHRCAALFGLAAVKRVTEDTAGALEDLEQAEALAVAESLLSERSRIHVLRGNLLFPRGDFEACLREHEAGLSCARAAERADLEAAALGGIGDAQYVAGRMQSARERLEHCIVLAQREGLGRIEVANQAQVAHTLVYTTSNRLALETACAAIAAAQRVGHARAEINARAAQIKALFHLARYQDCVEVSEQAERLIEWLGTPRFLQICRILRARSLHALGEEAAAVALLEEGVLLAERTGFGFHGPAMCSALAVAAADPAVKRRALAKAEAGVTAGCVGHNQYRVYADGIDVAVQLSDPELLRRHLEAIVGFPPGETVSFSRFHAARGRALLARLEGPADDAGREDVRSLNQEAEALGLVHWRLASA